MKIMNILSERVNRLEGSGIRRIFELASRNKGEYINLSIGQPDFKVSNSLKLAAKKAIDEDFNSYTSTAGSIELKEIIIKKLLEKNSIHSQDDELIITAGVSGAIFLLLATILNEGDEVILPDPYFVVYDQVIKFFGAKVVLLDTYPDFHIDSKKLESLITKKTKAIIINSPGNPTGAVFSREELALVTEVAKLNNTLVISDEIYEYFDYDKKFFSIGSIYKNTVTLNGYSKSHAATGWRLGYAHGPAEIISAMNKLQQYTFVCAPSFAQHALAIEQNFDFTGVLKNYKDKRNLIYNGLRDKYELNIPEGAFYAFVKIPENRPNFIEELIASKILAVPGSVFSSKSSHFRICFAAENEVLEKAIGILNNLV